MRTRLSCVLMCCAMACADAAEVDATIDHDDQKVMSSRAFLNAHPDLKFRTEGWLAYDAGRHEEALQHFHEAARYGDKLSQAMLAEMLWEGRGQPIDRPLAYAWSDLAAERGYRQFVALRERLWAQLGAAERAEAVARGSDLVAEYGDAVTRARIADTLRKARRNMLGKRPRRDVVVVLPSNTGGIRVQGGDFYDAKFWEPGRYQAWLDAQWAPLPRGQVDVGGLERVPDGDGGPLE